MKFFADEMLGKLARWLRMEGFDVRYEKQIADQDLLRIAQEERRLILTRDTKLIKKLAPQDFLFVTMDLWRDQREEFYKRFPELLDQRQPFSRCVECNSALEEIAKEKVRDKVWPFVFQTQEHFTTCPTCQRIYWRATHVEKIKTYLNIRT